MATYALSGVGVQTLSANVTALHVTITTLPPDSGSGAANPTDYYGIALVRFGDAVAFFDPVQIVGGPQWLAVPAGTTRLAYSCENGSTISVVEVIGGTPPFGGGGATTLAGLSDVALATLADAQVLAYQASSSKWINATPAGGSGGSGTSYASRKYEVVLSASATSITVPASGSFDATYRNLRAVWCTRCDLSGFGQSQFLRINGDAGSNYDTIDSYWFATNTLSAADRVAQTSLFIPDTAASGAASGWFGMGEILIPNYSGSTQKVAINEGVSPRASTTLYGMQARGVWRSTAVVTSITIRPTSGNYIAGSYVTVYLE